MKLSDRELKLIESIAKGRNSKDWMTLFDNIIREVTDVTNFNQNDDLLLQLKTGLKVKEILEETFIKKIKILSGELDKPNVEEYI